MNAQRFKAAQQQLEIAANLETLWKGLFPSHDCPGRLQFLTWASMYSEETAVYAFNRACRKVQREPMDDEHLGRYISGIMKNERDGRHVFADQNVAREPKVTATSP
jgi:hypothetical protein